MTLTRTLGFLGFGNMGQAIYNGLVVAGTAEPERVAVYDVDAGKRELAADATHRCESAAELAGRSDILMLATKPQDMGPALEEIAPSAKPDTLFISIAAGIGIGSLQRHLGDAAHIARVMPNTPALLGAGAAGIAFSETCSEADRADTVAIFEAVGIAETVPEQALDAVTAVSGSGPAYFFYFVECLSAAGVELGLPEEQARRLAIQTAYGAGRMLSESGDDPATLREKVTSKGGTTFAALDTLRGRDFEGMVKAAVAAAAARARELGQ